MATATGAYLRQPEASELRWMGETFTYFLATGEQTGETFTLVDEQAKRGMSVPLHLHGDDMESFYVVEGEITLSIGDQPGVRAGAGSFAHLPGGTVHGFRIESETARYLILTTPRHGGVLPRHDPPFPTRGLAAARVGRRSADREKPARPTVSSSSAPCPTETEPADGARLCKRPKA